MKKMIRDQILTAVCLAVGVGMVAAVYVLPLFIQERK